MIIVSTVLTSMETEQVHKCIYGGCIYLFKLFLWCFSTPNRTLFVHTMYIACVKESLWGKGDLASYCTADPTPKSGSRYPRSGNLTEQRRKTLIDLPFTVINWRAACYYIEGTKWRSFRSYWDLSTYHWWLCMEKVHAHGLFNGNWAYFMFNWMCFIHSFMLLFVFVHCFECF